MEKELDTNIFHASLDHLNLFHATGVILYPLKTSEASKIFVKALQYEKKC